MSDLTAMSLVLVINLGVVSICCWLRERHWRRECEGYAETLKDAGNDLVEANIEIRRLREQQESTGQAVRLEPEHCDHISTDVIYDRIYHGRCKLCGERIYKTDIDVANRTPWKLLTKDGPNGTEARHERSGTTGA